MKKSPFKTRRAELTPSWMWEKIGDTMLRSEDQSELNSISGLTPGKELANTIMNNNAGCWVARLRRTGEIAAIFGKEIQSGVPGRVIWMVGTPVLEKCVPEFLVTSKIILDHWLDKYGSLHNVIDLRNTSHINWLVMLGFELPPNQTCEMHNGVPFQYFYKEK